MRSNRNSQPENANESQVCALHCGGQHDCIAVRLTRQVEKCAPFGMGLLRFRQATTGQTSEARPDDKTGA